MHYGQHEQGNSPMPGMADENDPQVQEITDFIHVSLYGGDSPDGDTNPKILESMREYLQAAPSPAQAGAEVVGDLMTDAVTTAGTQGAPLKAETVVTGTMIAAAEVADVMRAEGVELTPDNEVQILMGSIESVMEDTAETGIWDDPEWQQMAQELWSDPEEMEALLQDADPTGETINAINQAQPVGGEQPQAGGAPAPAAPAPQMSARDRMTGA